MDKEDFRQHIWNTLQEDGVAAFPFPPHGRIPNFVGALRAADQLAELDVWKEAHIIKFNPDSPQRYARIKALEQGKIVYMAVPRLKKRKCFVRIEVSPDEAKSAASISGAFEYGKPVHPSEMEKIGMIVTGCVAVTENGNRIGKGEGYSDIELAVLHYYGIIDEKTPVATTVHEAQITSDQLPQDDQDIQLDWIITENRVIDCQPTKPEIEIRWDLLSEKKIDKIPILQELKENK